MLISRGRVENGLEQHQNVIDAAKDADVKTIAYTSRCMEDRNKLASKIMKRHFLTEDHIIASGMDYIFFRNISYMDALVTLLGKNALETGIYLPAGEGRASYALKSDQAETIGNVLANEDQVNQVNTETYSLYDVASALSALSGHNLPINLFTPQLFN